MLQIYGRASSINVRKVLWSATELGLDFQHFPYGDAPLSLQSEDYLKLNPLGLIPVIVDQGRVLRESNTICRYLATKHGASHLLPESPAARAEVEMWMDWQQTELNNAWRYAFMALVRNSPAHQQAELLQQSERSWNQAMLFLEQQLQKTSAYVCGTEFTLADVVLGLSVQRWYSTPIQHAKAPAVAAYYALLSERPAYQLYGCNGLP